MQLTFISLHDTTPQCNILYVSDSVTDILGYHVSDVVSKSTFAYFHPEDAKSARTGYHQNLESDQASVLCHARIKSKTGDWLTCECIYSCVGDILVAATSLRSSGRRSEGRAIAAEVVRRAFKSPEPEPRREMVAHISARFVSVAPNTFKETRAVLILNRFSRSLPVLYATYAISEIVGLNPDDIHGLSFLSFIEADCVEGVVRAIDRAKENDSIAYMRFWWLQGDKKEHDPSLDTTSMSPPRHELHETSADSNPIHAAPIEVESIVSCASDGIIIVLRTAQASIHPTSLYGTYAVPRSGSVLSTDSSADSDSAFSSGQGSTDRSNDHGANDDPISNLGTHAWSMQNERDNPIQQSDGASDIPSGDEESGHSRNDSE